VKRKDLFTVFVCVTSWLLTEDGLFVSIIDLSIFSLLDVEDIA
jgi:hypothetical protein